MRKIVGFTFIATALLLVACNPLSPAVEIPEGQVVSCDEIKTVDNPASNLILDCLDSQSKIDLADVTGPTVINFWGSWCGPCRDEIPFFVDLANSKPDGLVLIGVDREETSPENATKFIKDFGITYPQLNDPTGLSKSIVGPSVPVTIFVNTNGQITHQHIGPIKSADELRELILEHLGI